MSALDIVRKLTRMRVVPVTLAQAQAFVSAHHRHNNPPRGWKFGVGLANGYGDLIGVATAGRPVARLLAAPTTLEVNRTCTTGVRNANSMLYGAIRRAAVALGYERIYTYTQEGESGASLRAAGFRVDASLPARPNWHDNSARGKRLSAPDSTTSSPRVRWVWP